MEIIIAVLLLILVLSTAVGRAVLIVLFGLAWYAACFGAVLAGLILISVMVA